MGQHKENGIENGQVDFGALVREPSGGWELERNEPKWEAVLQNVPTTAIEKGALFLQQSI